MPRILIIEDESILARDLAAILDALGHEVVGIASRFEDGLKLAKEHEPDLALVDIHIEGGRDGIALAVELREEHDFALAFITSDALRATVQNAAVTRPNGYLVKPFDLESVDALVAAAISNHGGSIEAIDGVAITANHSGNRKGLTRRQRETVQRFIDRHLDKVVSIETLAAECNLSVSEFSRRFRVSLGVAPHQYLNAARLSEAKRLLRNTDWPIVEIALSVGFANQSHFTSAFKKSAGTTPSKYREFSQSH